MPTFHLLGPFELRDPAGLPVPAPRRKQRELLALLLLRAGTVVGVEEIVEALWERRVPASARANVYSYVSGLRALLTRVAPAAQPRPRTAPGGYRLDLQPDECDVEVFERAAEQGHQALRAGQPERAAAAYARALGLWRGDALAGLGDGAGWWAAAAARLEEARLAAVEGEAEARLRLGHHEELVGELTTATVRHPLRERLAGLHMRALVAAGRRADAVAAYNRVAEALEGELGVEPGPELRRLHRQIRADRVPAAPPPPADPSPPPSPPPPPAPVPARGGGPGGPRMLPPDVPDFTGRAAEVGALVAALTGPGTGTALAGVAGMAGVGKTALAVHAAHQLAGHFPDGQLFVDLQGAGPEPPDPGEVLAHLLRVLGVDGRAVPADPAERTALYRDRLAGRRVLVVLDNAADERQVRPLLPGSATCAVLVTSRRRLAGLAGVRWTALAELPAADCRQLLARVAGEEAVRRQPAEATEIVGLCGRLPLAVRIAGAKLAARPGWPLRRLADQLRDERRRLDVLAAGDLALRSSLTLGRQALDDASRRLLAGLSLFDVPDFSAALAAAVLDDDGTRSTELLEGLVDAHLVAVAAIDAAGQVRYRFHDLVRLVVREEAGPAVPADVLGRGLGSWLWLAERMAERIPGPCYAALGGRAARTPAPAAVDRLDPMAWFDAEHRTLVAAVRQACALGLDELAFDLAGRLEKFFDMRGMYAEWTALNTQVHQLCRRTGNQLGAAVMLRGLVDVRMWIGTAPGGAGDWYADAQELLALFGRLGEDRGRADAAVQCSWALTQQGRRDEAVYAATRALRWADATGHRGGVARAQVALAVARHDAGRTPQAIEHLTAALAAARELGNARYEATVQQFLGLAHAAVGDLAAAEEGLAGSLAITRRHGDDFTETLTLLGLARVHHHGGDPRAGTEAAAALALAREHAMTYHVADSLELLGAIALAAGRPAEAVHRLEESVALWRAQGWRSRLDAAGEALTAARARLTGGVLDAAGPPYRT